ncbi:MAG: class I SAM-dependent RNA methyltransferase, partial [Erysipelotrichaceae bacterium]|nr:class I SAM-dependent RNA methyltransferase [Erysipelotrichaceae bacterium]
MGGREITALLYLQTMKLEIVKTGINGEGIGYYRHKPVFVIGALEGETVDLESLKDNGRYFTGKLRKIVEKSENRVRPFCKYQKYCGGCPLMITNYENQLRIKKENLRETLEKYAGYTGKIENVIPSEKILNYRNKINLPFAWKDGVLCNAMYAPGSNHPVIIDKCLIHDEKLEKVRLDVLKVLNGNHVKLYDNKSKTGVRQLIIRGFEKVQIIIVSGNDVFSAALIEQIMKITDVVSLYQCVNTVRNPLSMLNDDLRLLAGEKTIALKLNDYKLNMLPKAFFQLNRYQADVIYKMIESL